MLARESAFRFFINEFLKTSQSFPLIMEAKLCRNISDYFQSYIVQQREVNKTPISAGPLARQNGNQCSSEIDKKNRCIFNKMSFIQNFERLIITCKIVVFRVSSIFPTSNSGTPSKLVKIKVFSDKFICKCPHRDQI